MAWDGVVKYLPAASRSTLLSCDKPANFFRTKPVCSILVGLKSTISLLVTDRISLPPITLHASGDLYLVPSHATNEAITCHLVSPVLFF